MGKTITEKILAKASRKAEVSPSEYVHVSSRCPITLGFGLPLGWSEAEAAGATKLFNPKLLNIVDGHAGVACSQEFADSGKTTREWVRKMGIPPENIYQLGRQGIEHVLSGERCWAVPGEVFFEGVNGHSSTQGALGAFAITLAYGSAAYLTTGMAWIRVPESTKFNIRGRLTRGVMARDVFEYVLSQVGGFGAPYHVIEWTGPVIDAMDMDGRFSLCCNSPHTGAWTGIINPDEKTIDYVKARTNVPFECLVSDPDAKFAKIYDFDVSLMEPQVVPPPKRDASKPVSELLGMNINRGFIGSCANSRLEDMRMAAGVLKGKKIHPNVQLNITPGTVNIYLQCIREGLLEIFIEAEATVPPPACGMCFGGANTPLGRGDVCISTGTHNYPGRMGSREAEIYLGNPATVAASCIEGKIADPRNYL
jgi:3-isopropylmalate/(R)-2-methylmalate dehydratase large subunit